MGLVDDWVVHSSVLHVVLRGFRWVEISTVKCKRKTRLIRIIEDTNGREPAAEGTEAPLCMHHSALIPSLNINPLKSKSITEH